MTALDRILEAAAEARSARYPAVAARPSERRCAEEPGSRAAALVRAESIEIRAAGGDTGALHFTGFASVYNRGYEMWDMFGPYTEQVTSGAGAASLAREELDVPFVLAHDSLRRIARTTNGSLTLSETTVGEDEGLLVDAPSLDAADVDVAYIAPKLKSGLIDEMSFRFRIIRGEWSPDWMEYHINEYDIHRGDVAIVGYGANPHTQGAGLRSQEMPKLEDLTEPKLRELENALHAERKRRGLVPAMTGDQFDAIDRATVLAPVSL